MKKHLKDYFIPHEGNDYKPHSLQKAAMTGMVLLVLLSFTLANVQSFLWVASDWMVSTILPAVIVELTNDERSDDALGQLQRNTTLDQAAAMKAQHMAEREYFSHFSPNGVSPWFWFAEAEYNFVHAGENLAIHFTDSGDVVDAWMESPTHRANIMNGNYTQIGVGTAEGEFEGFKTVYVVQLFGTPAAQASAASQVVAPPQTPEATVLAASPQAVTIIETPAPTEVLAEAVAITENIEVFEAEPEEKVVMIEVEPEPVQQKPDLYSSFISTSTGAVPASIDPTRVEVNENIPYIYKMLTQPHAALQIMYVIIGLFVTTALVLSVFIEFRRQQPMQIAYSLGLLVLMTGLFYIHEALSASVIIV